MSTKLTQEQRQAIRQSGCPVEVEDEETKEVYVLVDGDFHDRAAQALDESEARRAIRNGINELEAGRVLPLAELDTRIRARLGLPRR